MPRFNRLPASTVLCCLVFLIFSFRSLAQNRLWDRPAEIDFSFIMPGEDEGLLMVSEKSWGIDSTQMYLMSADLDQELTYHGGLRLEAPHVFLNDAAKVAGGAVLAGGTVGFFNEPFLLRMNILGEVPWSLNFNSFANGQNQFHSAHTAENRVDLFTRAGSTTFTFSIVNGYTNGSFPSGLNVRVPGSAGHRVQDVETTGNPREYIVLTEADSTTGGLEDKFIVVSQLDSLGVQWARVHDHNASEPQFESSHSLIQVNNNNWAYIATFRTEDQSLDSRLVKMNGTGDVIWAREYFHNGERLGLIELFETADGGLLTNAYLVSTGQWILLKLEAGGEVDWSLVHEQNKTPVYPLGRFVREPSGQLYSWNYLAISEMDENGNICDMVLFEGIVSEIANVVVSNYELSSELIEPVYSPFEYYFREATFENSLNCVSLALSDDLEIEDIIVYPNPFQNELTIDLTEVRGTGQLSALNVLGQTIYRTVLKGGQNHRLITDNWPGGTHLVRIVTDYGTVVRRMIKN